MNFLTDIVEQKYDVKWAAMPENKDKEKMLFFGSHPSDDGKLTKSCLSQWWGCKFTVNNREYTSAEQFMMAAKAMLFGDTRVLNEIMANTDPKIIKTLGRQIRGFEPNVWNKHKYTIVYFGNLMKFSKNEDLKEFLISTGDAILAEASPYDSIWGIKLSNRDIRASDPNKWQGTNLLGFALMQVRDNFNK